MITLIPRGLKIIAGGCRYPMYDGTIQVLHCDECAAQGRTCGLVPWARRLAEVTRDRRRKTGTVTPPIEAEPSIDW